MYNSYNPLFSSRDRLDRGDCIYNFDELAFPQDGVEMDLGDRKVKRPYIIFNMVSSIDGKATTNAGKLTGLGSRPDRQLMKRLRSQVDGVVVGGETLRRDVISPLTPPELLAERRQHFVQDHPLGIVITNSGNIPEESLFWKANRDIRLVIANASASLPPWLPARAQIYQSGSNLANPNYQAHQDHQIDLAQVLPVLFTEFKIRILLVEGGGTLNYGLISQGFADEMFMTLSPHVVGGIANKTVVMGSGYGMGERASLPELKLRSLYHHESELFLRYQFVSI